MLQSWMDFDTETCTLICHPNQSVTGVFFAKILVTTASGGSDAIIAEVVANPSLARQPDSEVESAAMAARAVRGPNPTRGAFALPTPAITGASAIMAVYDLSGRRVGRVQGPAGRSLVWEGRDATGAQVPPGLYLYRLEVGRQRQGGKIVVIR
jgi:hypothetical protein